LDLLQQSFKLGWNKSNASSPVLRLDVQVTGVLQSWNSSVFSFQDRHQLTALFQLLFNEINTFSILLSGSMIQ